MSQKKVLNVGGNNKSIALPPQYTGFEHLLLDIDPTGQPDICCDARELATLQPGQFDAIYNSHNLEHYYRHDVEKVLSGFRHVLKDGGFIQIRVPDMSELFRRIVEGQLDIEDTLYQSAAGPIMPLDVIYGFQLQIERSGQEFFAHKTGFTQKSLMRALQRAGFSKIYSSVGNLEVNAVAFKGQPSDETLALWGLPPESVAPVVTAPVAEAEVLA
ncbi:methyltransferase [beta proteobacterium AAP121]|nr:methyltransferase [beta proteobacterium AAP65]KPF99292.1 methyltransferase [beta proteobacterium AAP121]